MVQKVVVAEFVCVLSVVEVNWTVALVEIIDALTLLVKLASLTAVFSIF